ncbi:putative inorganic carbon transporter subunit DabA [Legionella sp. W05-934-2]|jgi:uncharacterized protein YbcC (UPF0753/DUF2309 family)|uniref:putative inorganic carbon transporter subunit DabA n=1 Tax=Legionella sp. W05-934-2 TaxID=1198649 RepID=UPI0034619963
MMSSDLISDVINKVFHAIPEQGPLEFFVHHNTLHHYEHLNFFDAVKKASQDFKSRAFMPEIYYWQQYHQHRIEKKDIDAAINEFLHRRELKVPPSIIYNLLMRANTNNSFSFSQDVKNLKNLSKINKTAFYKHAIKSEFHVNIDYIISPHIYKFFACYFDFGSAYWPMASREKGMWHCFKALYSNPFPLIGHYLETLINIVRNYQHLPINDVFNQLLERLQIDKELSIPYLFDLTYRFKGWAGMLKSLKNHPEWIKEPSIVASEVEFMLILMICEFAAIEMITPNPPKIPIAVSSYQHSESFINTFVYQCKKYPEHKEKFENIFHHLTDLDREEILHRAYEKSFYTNFLDAYASQTHIFPGENTSSKIDYQVICCIDEREESLRRYLEIDPHCETYGTVGHFGLPIRFKGYFDKNPRALCPINVKPIYEIVEVGEVKNYFKLKSLFIYGELQWIAALSSKSLLRGTVALLFGFFTKLFPVLLDIFSPKIAHKIKQTAKSHINKAISTILVYRKEDTPTGIPIAERINLAASFLKNMGLSKNFSPYIFIVGHGSSSLNNPHEAAHDCGACGGGRGGANARLMALILNESIVRDALRKTKHITIPEQTQFIGCYHNTCDDNLELYDLPKQVDPIFNLIIEKLHNACHIDAAERSRRFTSLPFNHSPNYYHQKVRERAIDFRQPRPEYGHATNAVCIVGPRIMTRNLFLDRRAFLLSYDEKEDPSGCILNVLLNTAGPVCAGINLEYYFSYIDNEKYGCGTKLPHNITSLLGVMNGYQSDLQLGLPWQMVEIHEPVRLMVLIVCRLDIIKQLLNRESNFSVLVINQWIELSIHDTDTNEIFQYHDKSFHKVAVANYPPSYLRIDQDILNSRNAVPFGHIVL